MIKALFWEIVARLGFWVPCNKHLPDKRHWDWVLISLYEPGMPYRYVPHVAEYVHKRGRWNSFSDDFGDNEHINNDCKITHWHKIPRDRQLKIK